MGQSAQHLMGSQTFGNKKKTKQQQLSSNIISLFFYHYLFFSGEKLIHVPVMVYSQGGRNYDTWPSYLRRAALNTENETAGNFWCGNLMALSSILAKYHSMVVQVERIIKIVVRGINVEAVGV